MTENGVPMLSDFGQAHAILYTFSALETSNYYRQKGTLNWIAPDIACYINTSDEDDASKVAKEHNEIKCTKRSDMWSYGIVIYVSCCFSTVFLPI